jgi:glycosyltransferase involved in cell wall biosynthesis
MGTCWAVEPDVSVVIPARDEERYVGGALASVAAQRWPAGWLEVVVVDNGSTDGTAAVVRAFAAAHPRLAVRLVAEPVAGLARAKNRGAAAARGRYLLFLDADSRLAPDLVARVMARVAAGYPAGGIAVVADSADLLDRGFFGLMEFGKRLFRIHAQMFYCARDLFAGHGGFDEGLQLAEDSEFLGRLARAGVPLCHVTESRIATSPRRLRRLPLRLAMVTMLVRWALAHAGVGRRWRY